MRTPATEARRRAAACAAACLFALAFGAPPRATALPGRLAGFVDLTDIRAERDDDRLDTLRREGVLNWTHSPASLVMLQSGLRYFRYDVEADLEGDDWREETVAHGSLNLRPAHFTFTAGARRRDATSRSTDGDLITDSADFMFATTPRTWPIVSLRYAWRHIHDAVSADVRDTYDRSLRAGLDWNRDELQASYAFTLRRNENVITGLDSRIADHVVRLGYFRRTRGDDPLRLNAQTTLSRTSQSDERSGAADVLERVPYLEGLAAVDASPEFGRLEPVTGLNDGDLDTPVSPAVDLGGAVEDRNVGVDLGFRRLTDTIYLGVDRVPGDAVAFTVWTSEDNDVWTLWDAAPDVVYNAGPGRFEIRYREAENRYVKVVKGGLAATTSLLATELEIFRTLAPEFDGRDRTRTTALSSARADYRLAPQWRTVVDLSHRRESSDDDYDDRTATDYALRLLHELDASIDHELSWEQSFQSRGSDDGDLRGDLLRYSLRARPYEELRGSLSAGRRWTYLGGLSDLTTSSVGADLRGVVSPEIAFVADTGWSRSHYGIAGRRSTTLRGRVGFELRPRPGLDLGLGSARYRTHALPEDEVRVRQTWDVDVVWRPTGDLMLRGGTSLSRDDLDTESSSLMLDWRLTPKLSAGAQAIRTRAGRGSDTDRVSAHLNYRFHRRGLAYLRYSEVDFREAGGGRTAVLQQGLRVSF